MQSRITFDSQLKITLKSFKFEYEDYYDLILRFLAYSLQIDTPGKLHCIFFSPQKLARLFPLKEVKPSPDR